eukprot:PhM_4_TR9810/c0_g1_i5/m.21867
MDPQLPLIDANIVDVCEEIEANSSFRKMYKEYLEAKAKSPTANPETWYWTPKQRGRQELLTEYERDSVIKAIALLRTNGYSVTSCVISDVARGIVKRLRPGLLENSEISLGREWAQKFAARNNIVVRTPQTDRVCTDEEVRQGR